MTTSPRFCKRCKRANNGDGAWVKPLLWKHDSFLREVNRNIERYGKIEKLDACEKCVKDIKSRGHFIRRK